MAKLSRLFSLKPTYQFLLLTCLGLGVSSLGLSSPGFSQVTFENAFPSLTFEFPVEIQNTGISGDDRLFVVGQRGTIRVFNNNASVGSTSSFLDIQSEVFFNVGQELGLLGLAFHPNYETNGYFYVYYTRSAAGTPEIVVERFQVDSGNPNQANKSSRQVIFRVVKNQSSSNHNGGKIAFGPDGYLYISIGDGGGAGDPKKNGQNVNTYFGSILRLDVDLDGNNPVDANGLAPEGRYEIPANNPLVGREGLDEIYAWGIRNTWKMSFDPPTGRLWGGDVGQNAFEEINLIVPGNFGWNRFEGVSVYDSSVPDPGNAVPPVFYYSRSSGDRSVTGGYVYRGSQVGSIAGKYLFADYVSGRVWALDYNATTQEATRELLFQASSSSGSSINVSTFGLDINGEMYFAGYGSSGSIYKLKDGTTGENAVAVNGVGSWNDDLGNIQGEVNAIITTADQTVYVGGNFSEVGSGTSANNVARWTPASGWESLGSGTNGVVNALALDANGALYVGGSFTTAGGTAARNVAKYTPAQNWEALAGGVSGAVLALTTAGNTLYVGGAFVAAGGTTVNNVAAWNGSWSALRDSNTQQAGTNNEIRSMAVDEAGTLYVGGNFGSAGGKSASRIARWDGSRWIAMGEGTSGFVQSIVVAGQYIYAGGNFTIAGNQTVNRIARWNRSASTWSALNNGLSNSVNAMVADENFLYVGGQFHNALNTGQDNIIVNNVVRWSEAGWEALGEGTDVGVDNYVNVLRLQGATLYAGGRFETAGNQTVRNLATWSAPATITIYAAGNLNTERMELRIDGKTVKSWNNIQGNAYESKFVAYRYTTQESVSASQLQVAFTNDQGKRDLRVDKILINNTTYQSEAATTYSTGTWSSGNGCGDGYKQSEWLHCNGYFAYGQNNARIAESEKEKSLAEDADQLLLFPNPVENVLHLRLSAYQGPVTVQLMDMAGREVLHYHQMGGQEIELPVQQLSHGLYQVSVQMAGQRIVQKLIVGE